MKLSYWEYKTWLQDVDFTIVGSGIVGLCCALFLKEKHPKSKVLVLERGLLPQGASTKNAGFACFGSISEILSDVKQHSEQEVQKLVQDRYEGIQLLRRILGDKNLAYQQNGGHEVFLKKDNELYEQCIEKLDYANDLLKPIFKVNVFDQTENVFVFENVKEWYITHTQEGQIDTGKMMINLLKLCTSKGVLVLNGIEVEKLEELQTSVSVLSSDFDFVTKKVFVATNGFASKLLNKQQVKPARAQVLITEPIPNLKIKGTFHLEEGYYYFRNVDNRILLGGGRNLDFKGEETTRMGETESIQSALENLLKEVILPKQPFEIAQRWSGIMGVGNQKTPIIEQVSTNVFCGVRLGGMGVALGSLVGKDLAGMI
ncbi:NAD(P)/FAD-dependent oxidoreductase [Flagellimonas meridianipacifica]|uniref:Glycine/D-amino acid oxidase-like deaminating enzyme n=1 Tax=Flagellimonas meridianipacifica TaxID=1080225 RepID=A0A2T0MH09_9FLAO|nr:FAD-dependent oxidoreductase [Allomuricauda pacifica]PRX56844.1 glycine/D-amino acid oxidase-like deaminating enzyme [Allomuricauda pacifica]